MRKARVDAVDVGWLDEVFQQRHDALEPGAVLQHRTEREDHVVQRLPGMNSTAYY
jgi:hypothetical protein